MRNASRSVAWERIVPTATLLLLSLLAAGPLWGAGLLNTRGGGDSPFLLLRTHQLAANLRAGVFPVRWMPDAAYGFGYPFFSYYAALPYYVAAGFDLLGLDILTAVKLAQTVFLAASALTMYRWAERVLHSRPGAWLAAVAYVATPFHLVNLYVRGDSLSEVAAFALYPLILLGFGRLASQPSMRHVLLPAFAYASLIVTHNVSALIFSPFILLYLVFQIAGMAIRGPHRPVRRARARSSLLLLPVLMALLLSAWFWLPALTETHHVQLNAQTSGYFFYGNHFRGADLVQRTILFDYSTEQDTASPFAMGLVQCALALVGAVAVLFRGARSRLAAWKRDPDAPASQLKTHQLDRLELGFGFLGLLLSTWLITPLSQAIWDHLPLLAMAQFPWRFLSIQALFTALLTGAAIAHMGGQRRYRAWAAALALGAVLITVTLVGLEPDYLPIRAGDVNTERLQLYELFSGNIGSTIRHEYLPRWVKPRPYTGPALLSPSAPARAIPISGSLLRAQRLDREPTHRVWHVETRGEGADVAFPLYYWPGWRATVDGIRQGVRPVAGSGYLSLHVPPGSHMVELRLGRTPLRLGAELASLITALAMATLHVQAWKRRRTERKGRNDGHGVKQTERGAGATIRRHDAAVPYLTFIATLSLIVALHPRVPSISRHDLTMDFEEMPYLHHNPDGAPFNGWKLINYRYETPQSPSDESISAGKTLSVTLDWKSEARHAGVSSAAPTKLRLVSPAVVRHAEVPAIVEAPIELGQGQDTAAMTVTARVDLVVPDETAPGIYLLQVDAAPPIYLRPIWVETDRATTGEPVYASFADGALRLHDVHTSQPTPDRLDVQLDWSAVEPVPANYGLSLSLTDVAGNEWLHTSDRSGYDTQPGHGFLPTSLWPLYRIMEDRHVTAVLPAVPPGDNYILAIDLYQVATWESVGQYTVTTTLTRTMRHPDAPAVARFGDEILLSRIDTPRSVRQGEVLEATAYWSTVTSPSEDYVVEWQLERSDRSITSTQPMAAGSSPKAWPEEAWIAGRVALRIPPMTPPGDYALSLTLKEPGSGTRVGSYTSPTPVTIHEQERVWDLPEMERSMEARFGGMIKLAGYDLKQGRESLRLTLYWQALKTPDRHYMFFVHLANPETGEPLAQVDSMPRGFSYPTGQWATGEVIADDVELSTKGLPAGHYDLALGWYDPDTRQRLQAVDREGRPLADNRLLLPSDIILR